MPSRGLEFGPFLREIWFEMNCSEAKLKLEPCASGTLAPEERIELEEHLAICEGCRLELELTRAVMGTPSFESVDEPPAATPEAPPPETPDAPPPVPQHPESRPQTALYDEMSFDDLGAEVPAAGSFPRVPPDGAKKASDPSEADPFANFSTKPDEPAEPSSANWDFEPADVPRDSSPPEGSLSFANEALKRKHAVELKRKATLVRLALWGGGIGCGLVLLGVSVWIAFAFRQEKAPDLRPGGPSTAPQPETPTPAPPEPTATPNASEGGAGQNPTPTEPTTPAPTPSSPAPTSPVPTLLDATPGVAPPPGPPPPVAADGSTKSGSVATKAKPKSGAKGAPKPAPSATAPKGGSAGDEGEFPWKPVDDPPMTRPRQPEATPQPAPAPVNPAPNAGTAPTSPSPEPAVEPAPPAPEPAVTKPIDRLHLATETAAKDVDLAKLRKLKSSWKSLVASTAGPDRTRAKRGYADCLWSIQEISGRNSDRREALTAYRDYVLYAPAGGTDSRTISRMRFLEDILTDSK